MENLISYANLSIETLYFTCKGKDLKLIKYKLNEPVKKIYVKNINNNLHHGNDKKNSATAIVQAGEKSLSNRIRIPQVTQYHSFQLWSCEGIFTLTKVLQ